MTDSMTPHSLCLQTTLKTFLPHFKYHPLDCILNHPHQIYTYRYSKTSVYVLFLYQTNIHVHRGWYIQFHLNLHQNIPHFTYNERYNTLPAIYIKLFGRMLFFHPDNRNKKFYNFFMFWDFNTTKYSSYVCGCWVCLFNCVGVKIFCHTHWYAW